MKLYELPRDKNIRLYGVKNKEGKDLIIIFGHIDGAYSFCWLEDSPESIVHLHASTPLKKFRDGYIILDG